MSTVCEMTNMMCPKCGSVKMEIKEGYDLGTYIATCPHCGHQKTFTDVEDRWEHKDEMRFMRPSKIL